MEVENRVLTFYIKIKIKNTIKIKKFRENFLVYKDLINI